MHDLNSLIEKFWSNGISKTELERLDKNLKEIVDQTQKSYLDQEGFGFVDEKYPSYSESRKTSILRAIHALKYMEKKVDVSSLDGSAIENRFLKWRWIGGIAAGLLLIFLSYPLVKMQFGEKQLEQHIVKNKKAHVFMKILDNNSDTVANVLLPDGSISYLYPHSRISYILPFPANKRDISLLGMAKFRVAKDPSKPFTVFSNGVATTALGTYFKVEGKQNGLEIILYEGKLKVHSIKDSSKVKIAYLLGGQKLYVSNNFVYKKSLIENIRDKQKQSVDLPFHKDSSVQDSFQLDYHSTPLLNVFTNMGIKYHKHFSYDNKPALDTLPFTGHFNRNESLDVLLKLICGMNNLQYEMHGRNVIISTR